MNIIDNQKDGSDIVTDLPEGSVFKSRGGIFMRISCNSDNYNAVNLENGKLTFFPKGYVGKQCNRVSLVIEENASDICDTFKRVFNEE